MPAFSPSSANEDYGSVESVTVGTDVLLPPSKRPRRKRKELVLIASCCEERKFGDYREAVYPLLRTFGHFDSVPVEYNENNIPHDA